MRLGRFILCFVLAVMVEPGTSFAKKHNADVKTARRIYMEGARFFIKGRYQEAEVQFALAYRLIPAGAQYDQTRNKLLYYLGVCYYHSKKYSQAQRALTRFLARSPQKNSRKRDHAQRLLERTTKLLATRSRSDGRSRPKRRVVGRSAQQAGATSRRVAVVGPRRRPPVRRRATTMSSLPQTPAKPPPGPIRPTPIIVLGVGVVTLGVAGLTGYLSLDAAKQRNQTHKLLADESTTPSAQEVAALNQKSHTLAITTNVLLIAGGVIATTGLVLVLTLGRAPARLPKAAAVPSKQRRLSSKPPERSKPSKTPANKSGN